MSRKTIIAATLAGALAFAPLVGCGAQSASEEPAEDTPTEQTDTPSEEAADEGATEQLAGGWAVNTEVTASLSDDEREIFSKATEEYVGADLEPVTVLATQVVAGTNYAYLCQSTIVTANPTTSWAIAVVYNDLEGNASITSVTDIDLTDIKVAKNASSDEVVGGWEVRDPSDVIALSPEASEAFGKASENYDGVSLTPIALLGTQVVAGTNYLVLCQGSTVTQNPKQELYVAWVYADLEGNAEFTEVELFDLLEYV